MQLKLYIDRHVNNPDRHKTFIEWQEAEDICDIDYVSWNDENDS